MKAWYFTNIVNKLDKNIEIHSRVVYDLVKSVKTFKIRNSSGTERQGVVRKTTTPF